MITRYAPVNASLPSRGRHLAVAVPSRRYHPPNAVKPPNGLRVGIEDKIHLRGARTSGISQAYFDTYPPAESSAPTVQRLIDLGAVIVGKTGLPQFVSKKLRHWTIWRIFRPCW